MSSLKSIARPLKPSQMHLTHNPPAGRSDGKPASRTLPPTLNVQTRFHCRPNIGDAGQSAKTDDLSLIGWPAWLRLVRGVKHGYQMTIEDS